MANFEHLMLKNHYRSMPCIISRMNYTRFEGYKRFADRLRACGSGKRISAYRDALGAYQVC
jgi:hypothetical protein